jgi:hypothetical protein
MHAPEYSINNLLDPQLAKGMVEEEEGIDVMDMGRHNRI